MGVWSGASDAEEGGTGVGTTDAIRASNFQVAITVFGRTNRFAMQGHDTMETDHPRLE